MNTITPLTGYPAVGSSTSDSANRGKNYQPRQGQIFKATVMEARSRSTFILDIGGRSLAAQARTPLTVGQTLQLQVMSTAPQVELRILGDSSNLLAGKSITLLGDKIDILSLMSTLRSAQSSPLSNLSTASRQTLESFSLFGQQSLAGKAGGSLLKQMVDRLGLSFEALLARGDTTSAQSTLKTALLELAHLFKGADQLAETTNKLLTTLETYQLAQLQLDKENIFLFPLPLPFLEKGYLVVERGDQEKNEQTEDEERLSLHLSLQGLGNLRIDVLKNPEGLYLRFAGDSKESLQFLEQFKDDLLHAIIDTPILGISFSHEKINPSADLLKRLLPEGESLVNTTV